MAGALAAGVLGVSLIPAQSAGAAQGLCGSEVNNFSGGNYWGSTLFYEGDSAIETVRGSQYCGGIPFQISSNFATAWAMIVSHDGGGGFAQAGFTQHSPASGNIHPFGADQRTGSISTYSETDVSSVNLAAGSNYKFTTFWDPACDCEREEYGGTVIRSTSFDPYANWTGNFSLEFNGETQWQGTDVPGVASSPTHFGGLQVENTDESIANISLVPLTMNATSSRYAYNNPYGCSSTVGSTLCFDVWTSQP